MDNTNNGFENLSNCESEEEELPRPETVTVVQDELEDSDPFPSLNSDPLSVDPLSLEQSIAPPSKPIKEEVCVKIEPSDSEDEVFSVSSEHMPEDDGYRSASDEGNANKDQPKNIHLSDASSNINEEASNKLKEILIEEENACVPKGISAQEVIPKSREVHEFPGTQKYVSTNIDLRGREVKSGIVAQSCGSEMEVTQNQDKIAIKDSNLVRGPEVTYLEKDNSDLEMSLADSIQTFTEKTFKSSLNFPKDSAPEGRIESVKLLSLSNIKTNVKVVLTRCEEAEILASSKQADGECFSERENENVSTVNLRSRKSRENQINSVEVSRVEAETSTMLEESETSWRKKENVSTLKLRSRKPRENRINSVEGSRVEAETSTMLEESETSWRKKENVSTVKLRSRKPRENRINSVEGSRVEAEKSTMSKIGENRDVDGREVSHVWDEVSSRETKCAKVVKTVSAHNVENDMVPEGEFETSVRRGEAMCGEEQGVSERRDELGKHQSVHGSSGTMIKSQVENGNEGAVLKSWSCSICCKKFDNPFGMSGHTGHCKRRLEKERSYSPLIGFKDNSQGACRYKCEVCAQEFASMKGLKLHKTQVGHNNDLKKNEKKLNLNKLTTQLQDLKTLENSNVEFVPRKLKKKPHEPQMPMINNLSSQDNQSVLINNNDSKTDFSQLLSSRSRNVYGCDICGLRFSNSLKWKVHAVVHGKQTHYLNSLQGKLYQTSSKINVKERRKDFKGYSNNRVKDKPYQCDKCPMLFYSSFNFKTHLNKHLGIGPYKCKICGIAYMNQRSLNRHSIFHEHGNKCGLCGMSFTDSEQLENHQCFLTKPVDEDSRNLLQSSNTFNSNNSKSNEKHLEVNINSTTVTYNCEKNVCRICGKTLGSRISLKNHMYLHTGKPIKCATCDKTFSSVYRLKDHIRAWHTFEKPYQCDLCDRAYSGSNALRLHKKFKHALKANQKNMKKDKPTKQQKSSNQQKSIEEQKAIEQQKLRCQLNRKTFKCNECHAVFTQHGNLKRHHIRFHLKEAKEVSVNLYKCEICEAPFRLFRTLGRHMRRFHSEELSAAKSRFSRYRRTHNEKIATEGTTKSSSVEDPDNDVLDSRKRFQCNICDKSVSSAHRLKDHIRCCHTLERPYKCNLCDKAYGSSNSLRLHKKFKHKLKGQIQMMAGGIRKYQCDECPAKFSTSGYLLRHKNHYHLTNKKEEIVEKYKCELNTSSLQFIDSVHQHSDVINVVSQSGIMKDMSESGSCSGNKPIHCKYCTASYNYCKSFVKHLLQRHGIQEAEVRNNEADVKCDLCHKRLIFRSNLKRHKREVHKIVETEEGISENVHDKCNAFFQLPDNLLRHVRQTEKIGNTCDINLQSNDQIYKCDVCGAVFNENNSLLEHKASLHMRNEKKNSDFNPIRKYYKCNLCNAKYFNKYTLERHKRNFHFGAEVFQCSVCRKEFSSAVVLIKHHEKHFKNLKYSCSECGKSFKQLKHMEEHRLTHCNPSSLYHCDICSLSFLTLNDLKNHKQSHEFKLSLRVGQSESRKLVPRNHRCDICNKSFARKDSLQRHQLIHTTVCIYQCKICGVSFQERYKLILHTRTHSI